MSFEVHDSLKISNGAQLISRIFSFQTKQMNFKTALNAVEDKTQKS